MKKILLLFLLGLFLKQVKAQDTTLIAPLIQLGCGGDYTQVHNFAVSINKTLDSVSRSALVNKLFSSLSAADKAAADKVFGIYNFNKDKQNQAWDIWQSTRNQLGETWVPLNQISLSDDGADASILLNARQIINADSMNNVMGFIIGQVSITKTKSLNGLLYNLAQSDSVSFNQIKNNPQTDYPAFLTAILRDPKNNQLFQKMDTLHKQVIGNYVFQEYKATAGTGQLQTSAKDKVAADSLAINTNILYLANSDVNLIISHNTTMANNVQRAQLKLNADLTNIDPNSAEDSDLLGLLEPGKYGSDRDYLISGTSVQNFFVSVSVADQQKQAKTTGLLKDAQEFAEDAQQYVNSTQDVLTIAQNLGIKSPILDDAQKAVNYFNTGDQAIDKFADGDILGGLTSLSGLFGSKSDPVSAALQKVNDNLKTILNNQKIMIDQLTNIQAGIDTLLSGENKIYTTIVQLTQNMDVLFAKQDKKLDAIEALSWHLITLQEYYHAIEPFETVRSYIIKHTKKLDVTHNLMPDYNYTKVKIIIPESAGLSLDENGINAPFAITDQKKNDLQNAGAIYQLPVGFEIINSNINQDQDSTRLKCISQLLQLDSLFKYMIAGKDQASRINNYVSLLLPFYNSIDLNKKLAISIDLSKYSNQMKAIVNFLDCDLSLPFKSSMNNDYLEPDLLVESTDAILNFHYLFSFLNAKLDTLSINDVIAGKSIFRSKDQILKNAQALLNIAIAQQNMLSGDILIPYMYQVLKKGLIMPPKDADSTQDNIVRLCLNILRTNYYVRSNFMNYYIAERLKDLKRNPVNYSIGLSCKKSYYLQQTLGVADSVGYTDQTSLTAQLKLVLKPNADKKIVWSYSLPGEPSKYYPLPCTASATGQMDLNDLYGNNMVYNRSLNDLIQMKGYVDRAIENLYFTKQLPVSVKPAFDKLIVLGALSNK